MQPVFSLILLSLLVTLKGGDGGGGPAVRQDKATAKTVIEIEDLAWLAGHWRGPGLGGICEEVWSHPMAGTMMGTFRLVKDDKVVFYEIMILEKDEKGFALKVKHFSKEFVGWEKKEDSVRFDAESVDKSSARFSGLTMARDGDKLQIKVNIRGRGGKAKWETFQYERFPRRGKNRGDKKR